MTGAGRSPWPTRPGTGLGSSCVAPRTPATSTERSSSSGSNVTAGVDGDPGFGLTHPELLRHGSAYVGVSAQRAGVEGGGVLPIPGVEVQALKKWDPQRYGDLSHPGDPYSYDIFSQVAQAIRRPGEVDALDGLTARHVIAMGESQSAARMVTYVDAVHLAARIYDGFLIHSRGGGG